MSKITQLSQLDLNKSYSYADYMTWQLNEAIELIKGKVILMSPAPNVKHQDISMNLSTLLHLHFKQKNVAPMPPLLMCGFIIVKNLL